MKLSKKHYVISGLAAVALVGAALSPDAAMAAGSCVVGGGGSEAQGLLTDTIRLINGPFGATVGLVISLFGAYQWLVNQSNWGLIILAGGALLTVFPGIYSGLLEGLCNALPNTIGNQAGGGLGSGANAGPR